MQLSNNLRLLFIITVLSSYTSAFPLFRKRELITRMHTASTTNTVTYAYSTTTELVIAPTVYYIVDGDSTSTSTDFANGVNPTAVPTTTVIINQKDVQNVGPVSTTSTAANNNNDNNNGANNNNSATTTSSAATSTSQAQNDNSNAQTTVSALDEGALEQPPVVSHAHGAATTTDAQTIVSTSTQNDQQQTTTSSTVQQEQQQTTTSSIVQQEQQQTTTSSIVQQEQQQTTSTSVQAEQTTSSSSGTGLTSAPHGLAYSPYNDDGSCKSGDSVYSDLQTIKNKGISLIRIYGTDCNSLQTVQPAAASLGIKINQGLWIDASGVDSLDSSLSSLIEYGQNNGWDIFEYITIGNEAINSGYCSVQDLISKISSVKSQLKNAGYPGQVTTSEPPISFQNYPELCTASEIDFAGINPHSYFDANSDAQSAGTFVKGQLQLVQQACGDMNVVITETGYPSQGSQNGGNIPSKENQIIAVQEILNELNQQVTILTFTNDFWKNPGPYGVEQYFGVGDILP